MDDWVDGDEVRTGPLHPDDRLWRHPSELRAVAGTPQVVDPPPRRPLAPRLLLGALATAAVAGAWWTAESLEVEVDPTPPSARAAGEGVEAATRPADVDARVTLASQATTTVAPGGGGVRERTVDPGLTGSTATVGVWVTSVDPEGPLARAGVRPGDLLLAIGGIPTTSPRDVRAVIALVGSSPGVPVDVQRGNRLLELRADFTR